MVRTYFIFFNHSLGMTEGAFMNNKCILSFCRRILIFPKGNNVDYLSMYLDVADSNVLPYGWSRYAQFSLSVVNQIHNKFTVRKGVYIYFFNYFFVYFFSF